jgi:tetratricopeptide (TPR) repeat protein
MRVRSTILALVATLAVASSLSAQGARTASAEAERANKYYADGWTAMRAESWNDAARDFQETINNDPKFALAYYSLGRAEMGLKDFSKAIAAYTKCRDLYLAAGDQFTNQMSARQRINDRIFEYRNALTQASAKSSSGTLSAGQSQSLYIRELQAQIARLEEARDRGNNVSLTEPVPYYVPMALGAAYFRSAQFADAEREYKEAIAANSGSGETHNNLAVLYLTTGRFDEAETEVKAAEKAGFKVNENLKGDIRKRRSGGSAG